MALADLFNDIADAIREKDGTSAEIVASTFPARIRAIPTDLGGIRLESIEITEPPTKTVYAAGEVFDPSGMVVYANFSNGQSMLVSHSDLAFDPSGPLEDGIDSVTVNFQWGLKLVSASQPISVYEYSGWWSPHMTSDTTPAPYVASADDEYIDGDKNTYYAYLAFDGSLSGARGDPWYSGKETNRFIQLYFGGKTVISGIRMFPASAFTGFFPKAVAIQISDDGDSWIGILEDSGNAYNPSSASWREIMFSAPASCRYCRILCGSAYDRYEQSIIAEIEFFVGAAAE